MNGMRVICGLFVGAYADRRRADLWLRLAGCQRHRGSRKATTKRIIGGNSELNEFMAKALQPLLDRYTPTWWTNSHIQCFLTFLVPQSPVNYKRDVLTFKDGGQASLDWALDESMRSLCAEALAHGYRPVVFNKRGHGGLKLATPKLQAFGCVQDLQEAIAHVENIFPTSELYGIGCSAGSGLLCSYLCELGDKSRLRAGVLISPGYNAFDLFCRGKINPSLKATSIREFDQHVYMKMHGYQDLEAYWKVNNPCETWIISSAFLCINALDDPVCTKETIRKPLRLLRGEFPAQTWCNEAAMTYLDRLREFNAASEIESILETRVDATAVTA
ncbi:Alpha/Beta hydrolase fold [Phytophthora cactorum]|nr:Alpha/Beta hydrolase fold [Phytophthora cactorum]